MSSMRTWRSPERKPVRVRRYARLEPVAPRYTCVIIPSFEAVWVAARASKDARLVPELRGKPRGGMLKATWQFSFVTVLSKPKLSTKSMNKSDWSTRRKWTDYTNSWSKDAFIEIVVKQWKSGVGKPRKLEIWWSNDCPVKIFQKTLSQPTTPLFEKF